MYDFKLEGIVTPLESTKLQNISEIYPPLFILVLSQSRSHCFLTKPLLQSHIFSFLISISFRSIHCNIYWNHSLLKSINESHHTYNTKMTRSTNLAMFGSFIYCILTINYAIISLALPTRVFCFSNCCVSFCPRYAV